MKEYDVFGVGIIGSKFWNVIVDLVCFGIQGMELMQNFLYVCGKKIQCFFDCVGVSLMCILRFCSCEVVD